jgi:LPXTG-motif cell wall-anchored protein
MRTVGLLVVVILLASVGTRRVFAQSAAQSFTLQPGGSAVVSFEAFCAEFGEVFPSGVQLPNGVAPDAARAAMAYGVSKGYNANAQQALQLQYAIWQALGATSSPRGDTIAQDVLTNGTTAPAAPQGVSVLDAVRANQITLTLDSWQPIGPKVEITNTATDHFYGRGQLTITNTTQQALTLYMPIGTVFPSVDATQQTMAGYATNVQVNNPQPQQLPATGGDESIFAGLLLGIVLLVGGLGVRRRWSASVRAG